MARGRRSDAWERPWPKETRPARPFLAWARAMWRERTRMGLRQVLASEWAGPAPLGARAAAREPRAHPPRRLRLQICVWRAAEERVRGPLRKERLLLQAGSPSPPARAHPRRWLVIRAAGLRRGPRLHLHRAQASATANAPAFLSRRGKGEARGGPARPTCECEWRECATHASSLARTCSRRRCAGLPPRCRSATASHQRAPCRTLQTAARICHPRVPSWRPW